MENNNVKKKSNFQKLNKNTFCELISFMKFNDYKTFIKISKIIRTSIMYYVNLYVKYRNLML